MTTYRHLNLLIDGNIHNSLRKYSRKQEVPISQIVREAIKEFLSAKVVKLNSGNEGEKK